MTDLRLLNRQRTRTIDLRLLRDIVRRMLSEVKMAKEFDLTIQLVNATRMTRLNETHLQHAGSTDVITFDYGDAAAPGLLAGEIFACVDEAIIQAEGFRTTWQAELARYIIHGILHLEGYDDGRTAARRKMKREEGRRLRKLARDFHLSKLQRKPKVTA